MSIYGSCFCSNINLEKADMNDILSLNNTLLECMIDSDLDVTNESAILEGANIDLIKMAIKDLKEVKASLKESKKALKNKDYKSAEKELSNAKKKLAESRKNVAKYPFSAGEQALSTLVWTLGMLGIIMGPYIIYCAGPTKIKAIISIGTDIVTIAHNLIIEIKSTKNKDKLDDSDNTWNMTKHEILNIYDKYENAINKVEGKLQKFAEAK